MPIKIEDFKFDRTKKVRGDTYYYWKDELVAIYSTCGDVSISWELPKK